MTLILYKSSDFDIWIKQQFESQTREELNNCLKFFKQNKNNLNEYLEFLKINKESLEKYYTYNNNLELKNYNPKITQSNNKYSYEYLDNYEKHTISLSITKENNQHILSYCNNDQKNISLLNVLNLMLMFNSRSLHFRVLNKHKSRKIIEIIKQEENQTLIIENDEIRIKINYENEI